MQRVVSDVLAKPLGNQKGAVPWVGTFNLNDAYLGAWFNRAMVPT